MFFQDQSISPSEANAGKVVRSTINRSITLYLRHPTLPVVVHAIILPPHELSGSHAIQQNITGKKNITRYLPVCYNMYKSHRKEI